MPEIGEEEIAEVVDSLRSGWITTGPKTRRFEQAFVDYLGGGVEAVAVNSATAGLHLAVEALGIGPGDEVITTTHTFTATAEVVRYMGAHPVFVDIDLDTYCMSTGLAEAAITPRTRALMPVHYAGIPCAMQALTGLARWRRGSRSSRMLRTRCRRLPTGSWSERWPSAATVFSFYATKTIATGEGGMLVTTRPEIARRARIMRLHGIDRDAFDRYTAKKPSWYYEVVAPGYKYNMTDLAASLGLHQLAKADAFMQRRAAIAARYDEALAGLPLVLPPRPAGLDTQATPGISTSCDLPTACDSGATRSCRRCTTLASVAACTTCRCISSRTGATRTTSTQGSSRTHSCCTSVASACRSTPA